MRKPTMSETTLLKNKYFAKSKNAFNFKPKVIYVGDKIVNNQTVHKYMHPYCEILYVLEGEGTCTIGDKTYKLSSGDLCLYNNYDEHSEYSEKGMKVAFLALTNIKIQGYEENCLRGRDDSPVINMTERTEYVKLGLTELIREMELQRPFYEIMTSTLATALIVAVLRLTNYSPSTIDEANPFVMAKDYIDRHYKEKITLEDICQEVFISKYYLSRSFKDYIGMSPVQYIVSKRIEDAKNLLVTTDLLVKEIADKVGYEDEMYFSKLFKDFEGISPIQYRMKCENKV